MGCQERTRRELESSGNIVKRNWRLISLILGIVVVFVLLYIFRNVLLPFMLGLVLAYLVLPVIRWIEGRLPRQDKWRQVKRVSLILLILLIILALVALLVFYLVTAVVEASAALLQNAPQYLAAGLASLQQLTDLITEMLPAEIGQEVVDALQEAGVALGNAIKSKFLTGISAIPRTFGLLFGFTVLPIFLFYVLKDSEKLNRGLYSAFSPWFAEHLRNIVHIVEMVLGRFMRAELLLGLIVAYFIFVGLLFMRIPFYPALAVFAGISELIPILGPWLSGAAAVIVTLAVAPEKAIWVALLFVAVQLLENMLLVPRIQGGYLRINPAIVVILLVLGAYLAGLWGMLLAVPLTATVYEIYKYLRANATTGAPSSGDDQPAPV